MILVAVMSDIAIVWLVNVVHLWSLASTKSAMTWEYGNASSAPSLFVFGNIHFFYHITLTLLTCSGLVFTKILEPQEHIGLEPSRSLSLGTILPHL